MKWRRVSKYFSGSSAMNFVYFETIAPAGPPDEIGDDRQDRHHDQDGGQSRQHQDPRRRDVHGLKRVDLLINLHAGEFGGDGRSDPAGDENRDHDRAQFASHGKADEGTDEFLGAKTLHAVTRLQCQHTADEKTQDRDDRQGRVTDQIALFDKARPLPRQGGRIADGPPQQLQGASNA